MSGGNFDYNQYIIGEVADSIDDYVNGHELDECDVQDYINDRWLDDDEKQYIRDHHHTIPNRNGYSDETIAEFRRGIDLLRKAYIYAQRIDWLLSGDDGEESFHERLKEELDKLENKQQQL